jgi:hypothetical protein
VQVGLLVLHPMIEPKIVDHQVEDGGNFFKLHRLYPVTS